jgi:glycolate oxidase iron-sulfur subunit
MQTKFTDAQRQDPAIRDSEAILRNCVHCGFCSATCPTYQILGDELDSPRGRIYLIKDMLEHDRPATTEVVRHIDRCLSCLACMTTCPSGVHYQHLVDHARRHIEATYRRPWLDRLQRRLLAAVMPYPARFRRLLAIARLVRPFAPVLPRRLRAALALVPLAARSGPAASAAAKTASTATEAGAAAVVSREPRPRVGIMTGCVQSVLGTDANAATVRLLERMGCEIVAIDGCCGSLTHHLGMAEATRAMAEDFVRHTGEAAEPVPLDAIVVNASGCGTHLKDYGFIFRDDAALAPAAGDVGRLTKDITEFVAARGLPPVTRPGGLRVAYHSACSLQHGQRVHAPPRELLAAAGYTVLEIPEAHLCCGSAGTYNILQPELAQTLAARKLANIATLEADVIAAGNLGCMTQLGTGAGLPIVHTVELLDYATGGPVPPALVTAADG